MAIDPNAMYRAGFARGTTGRNPQVERQVARQEKLINLAYETIGKVATTAVSDGYRSFQKFRDQLDSPMAASLTQIDKLPKENAGLSKTIQDISDNYRKANRKVYLSFGKKRRAAKAERQKWMTQMTDLNAALETIAADTKTQQGFARVAVGKAGVDNKAGNVNLSPGNHDHENRNTADLAAGLMHQNLRWNMDGGYMEVATNGDWITVDGKDMYVDKNINNNKELKKNYKAYATTEGGNAVSYEEWASNQDQTSITYKKYSDLRFGLGEDQEFEGMLKRVGGEFIKGAKGENALDWSEMEGVYKDEFFSTINGYKDSTFRDFYFGGYSFDYSSGRMDETAPAYQLLLSRNSDTDFSKGPGEDDNKDGNNFIPPGSINSTPESDRIWKGALTTLKAQSMVKGSVYRQDVAESQWGLMKEKYTNSRQNWLDKQAEKQQKIDDKYYAQNKDKYYNMSTTDTGGAQNILKTQVDPIVNVFNTTKDDGIVPLQSVPYLANTQFGKDEKGWYAVVNEMGYSDPNNRNTYGVIGTRRIDGSKDEIAAVVKVNSPQLGYQFSTQTKTTSTVATYAPGNDDLKVKKKKADIISQLDIFDKRGLNEKTVEELQAMLTDQNNKIKEDIKPRIKIPKRPGLND